MAKQITAYQADDGSIHETACQAATRNVELLVARSELAENQPFSRKLVIWLTENAREIRGVLHEHEKACPQDAAEGTREKPSEGTREPDAETQGDMA